MNHLNSKFIKYLYYVIAVMLSTAAGLSAAEKSPVLIAAKQELERTFAGLQSEKLPPYFISYGITDVKNISISASFGYLTRNNSTEKRILDIDLRVGSPQFDNTHIIRGGGYSFSSSKVSANLPLGNDVNAIRSAIWYATDRVYKKAIERYEKAVTNKAVKAQEEDSSADFSQTKIEQYYESIKRIEVDTEKIKQRVRRLSALFASDPKLYVGEVSFSVEIKAKYFVTTEGAEIQEFEPHFRIMLNGKTKADDGMSLPLYKSYFAYEYEGLPDDATIEADIHTLMATLAGLRNAPILTTFSGPAILSGEASGVFFHEIFGHRVEGHRIKDPSSSQTFKNFIGKKILPEFIDVVFDPTIKEIKGKEISGSYVFDDEGVRAAKVLTVENGMFKDFLMTRSPIENFSQSNGHARRAPGYKPVSRQSNLIVIAHETVPIAKFRDQLREECRKQDKEFGLLFEKVQGGFTFTGTTIPNSFNVNPLVVYKVYADGRPDELVRGVDLIGTPLTTFTNVIAASDDLGIFNGICGAESGGVPVSACSPSLLVSLIEAQKKAKSQAKPPILESPAVKQNEKKGF